MSDFKSPPDRPPEVHRYVLLHGRYAVLAELVEFVIAQLDQVILLLPPAKCYTARALMGAQCWEGLTEAERRLTGSVISHLAFQGELPLVKVQRRAVGEVNTYHHGGCTDASWAEAVGLRLTRVDGNVRRSPCQS